MDTVFPMIGLAALVVKFTDFLKFVTNRDTSAISTQVMTWLAGVAGVFLYSGADLPGGLSFGGVPITDLNGLGKLLMGLAIASTGSFGYDVSRRIDSSDTAMTPPLLPGSRGTAELAHNEPIQTISTVTYYGGGQSTSGSVAAENIKQYPVVSE